MLWRQKIDNDLSNFEMIYVHVNFISTYFRNTAKNFENNI